MNDYGLSNSVDRVLAVNDAANGSARDIPTLAHSIALYVLNPVIALLFALALIYFLVGVVSYVFKADNENERMLGGSRMLWGLVGMAIMIVAFAVVNLIAGTIGVAQPTFN